MDVNQWIQDILLLSEIILCMYPTNERRYIERRYIVMSLIR